MPYFTKKQGSKICVYKKEDGEKVGCASGSIKKYLATLHMNEKCCKELSLKLKDIIKRK